MAHTNNNKLSFSLKRTLVQYQKLLLRLRQAVKNGRFQQYSKNRQQQIISTLKRYHKQLQASLTFRRKLAIGSALIITLASTNQGITQTYVQPAGSANSLGFVDVGNNSFPAFLDIDNDGDQDVFVGNFNGNISFFENTGTANNPIFIEMVGANNPFDGEDVGSFASPVFADIDNDGDSDAYIGNNAGNIIYYENNGGIFTMINGAGNPFNGVDVGGAATPSFIDIDNDGDLDAFIGSTDNTLTSKINFFRNDGGTFTPIVGANNPFNNAPLGSNPMVTFSDYDNDGDFDAFVGSNLGLIQYYQNNGNNISPVFNLTTGDANPFNGVDVGRNSALIPNPCFVDINNDGNMDIFIGNADGTLNFFLCDPTITCTSSNFFKADATDNPLNGQDVGNYSAPSFIDIDQDGDQDLFVADSLGNINFFKNDGNSGIPNFTLTTGANNPFDGVDIGELATIDFVDIDNDGDADAFIGEESGIINFFRNDGTTTTPHFQEIVGAGNPFDGIDVGDQSSPSFADIDNDGDLDAFIGNKDGRILFFRNDGTITVPNFVPITDGNNPFHGVDLEGKFSPQFGDIDNDGDLDAIIGNKAGTLYFFRNDGNVSNPNFVGLYGVCNPFHGLLTILGTEEEFSIPALVDIDNDGALELFTGQFGGKICFIDQNAPQLAIAPKKEIPTLSEWGIITLTLLLLSFGTILIARKEEMMAMVSSNNKRQKITINQDWVLFLKKPPINWSSYFKSLIITALLALGLAFSSLFFYGEIALVDVFGALTAGPIFAYLVHLIAPTKPS